MSLEKIINDAWEKKDQVNQKSDQSLKDAVNQSKPFFIESQIQKDGREFLESKHETKKALKFMI